jgi:hypothetical protein
MELQQLREMAMEKFASEEEVNAFMDEFIKEAGLFDYRPSGDRSFEMDSEGGLGDSRFSEGGTVGDSLISGLTASIAKSTGGAIVNGAVNGIGRLIGQAKDMSLYRKFMEALNKAVSMNKILKGADRNKVLTYGETIFKFAPHVATDPNLLSSILANAIHGEGIDPVTIKTLSELEGRYRDNISFNPKNHL